MRRSRDSAVGFIKFLEKTSFVPEIFVTFWNFVISLSDASSNSKILNQN
jgi:hypothetical protein